MSKRTICPVVVKEIEVVPFNSAEEAWFWFCRIMMADYQQSSDRYEKTARPCEVNDIYRIVKSLMSKNLLNMREYKVLVKYGKQNQSPDFRFGATRYEEILWRRGLAILSEPLKQKAIIV